MAWQIIFIIFNYISLCNCARALAFGDGGVARTRTWTRTWTCSWLCFWLGLGSRFQLARYSQFYFRVTLKRKRKVKVADAVAAAAALMLQWQSWFLLARSLPCIPFGHFAHILLPAKAKATTITSTPTPAPATTAKSSSSSSFLDARL